MNSRRVVGWAALAVGVVATAMGVAVGLFQLLAPTQVRCELPALVPGAGITASANCIHLSVVEAGEPIWPLPLLAILLWSLAPAAGLVGILRILSGRRGMPVVTVALLVEATAVISFVAGPLFLIYVFVPLALATVLAAVVAGVPVRPSAVDRA